jgi:membrane-associated protease RseP (regulator of RpoE activity)
MRIKLLLALGLFLTVAAGAVAASALGLTSLGAQEADEEPQEAPVIATRMGGGYIGVYLEEVDGEAVSRLGLPAERGALITKVTEDSPAEEAGLLANDVIVSFNGQSVESISALGRLVRETPAGRSVEINVIRDGRNRQLSVEIGERPHRVHIGPDISGDWDIRVAPGDGEHGEHRVFAYGGRPRLGVQLQSLGDQLAEYFGVSGGALIASVSEDSPAAAAGLQAGDIITGIGDADVEDPGDAARAIHDAEEGSLTITVVRDGSTRSFTVDLPERHSGNWQWQSDDGTYAYSFVLPEIGIPEINIPEIRTPHVVIPEISIPSFEIDGDGEPWFVIPEITIPGFDIPEVIVPEFSVPEIDIPSREITIEGPVLTV